jgi:hypothetical protein
MLLSWLSQVMRIGAVCALLRDLGLRLEIKSRSGQIMLSSWLSQVMRVGAVCALRAGVHVACTSRVCAPHMLCACVSGGTACFIGIVCLRECGPVRVSGTSDRGPTQPCERPRTRWTRNERVSTRPSVRSEYISHMRPHRTFTLSHEPVKSVSTDSASVNSKARQGDGNSRWVNPLTLLAA